jgi:guanylate kinase
MKPGRLLVISSPSGGGKTTVVRAVMQSDPALAYSVSATTRPIRPGEVDGRDYHFMNETRFREGVRRGEFMEWAEVHGSLYGTLKSEVEQRLEDGRTVILDLDVQGGMAVKRVMPDSVLIFLLPPSRRVLEARLKDRGTESAESLARRLGDAEWEMKQADQYDVLVFNDRLEETVHEIRMIIAGAATQAVNFSSGHFNPVNNG